MDRPPPPHERTTPHGGVTLYTPESLRQWRLARQQKRQQLIASQKANTSGGADGERVAAAVVTPTRSSAAAAVHVVAQAAGGTSDLCRSNKTTETSLRRDHDSIDTPRQRTPTTQPLHRHAPYARPSAVSTNNSSEATAFLPPLAVPILPVFASPEMRAGGAETRRSPMTRDQRDEKISRAERSDERSPTVSTRTDTSPLHLPQLPPLSVPLEAPETTQRLPELSSLTCRVGWCTQPPKRHGLCWTHGGEKKCCRVDCGRAATNGEFCAFHHAQLLRD